VLKKSRVDENFHALQTSDDVELSAHFGDNFLVIELPPPIFRVARPRNPAFIHLRKEGSHFLKDQISAGNKATIEVRGLRAVSEAFFLQPFPQREHHPWTYCVVQFRLFHQSFSAKKSGIEH